MPDYINDIVIRQNMLPLRHDMRKTDGFTTKFYNPEKTHTGDHIHITTIGMDTRSWTQLLILCPITVTLSF